MFKVVRSLLGVVFICHLDFASAMMPMMGMGGNFMRGMGGMGMGTGMGFGGGGMGGFGGMKMLGGSEASGGNFGEGKKMFDDMFYKKGYGNEGMQFGMGHNGFNKGEGMMKDIKGELGFYNSAHGGKNIIADEKGYHGGKFMGNKGKNMDTSNAKKGHKKGRTVKGFHTSHESNEASNSEEVYDEEHDEADKKAFKGEQGKFAEKKGETFEGKKADAKFNSNDGKKEGKFEKKMHAGKASGEMGEKSQKKYGADGSVYELKKGGDNFGNSGHNEAQKMSKHYKI